MSFLIILFGVFLGIFGSLGGGANLISTPIFILLGLSPVSAIAVSKFGLLGLVLASLYKFQREKKILWKYFLPLAILSAIGSFLGVTILISINEALLTKIIAVIIIIFSLLALFWKELGEKRREKSFLSKLLGFIVFFFSSIYGGFFGGGGKFFKIFIFCSLIGFTIIEASAITVATGLISLLVSLSVLIKGNFVDFSLALPFALGMAIGGWFGTKIMIEKGEKFAKLFLIIATILLSLKILFSQ